MVYKLEKPVSSALLRIKKGDARPPAKRTKRLAVLKPDNAVPVLTASDRAFILSLTENDVPNEGLKRLAGRVKAIKTSDARR